MNMNGTDDGTCVDKDWYIAERIVAKRNDLVFLLDQLVHAGQNDDINILVMGNKVDYVKTKSGPTFRDVGCITNEINRAILNFLFNLVYTDQGRPCKLEIWCAEKVIHVHVYATDQGAPNKLYYGEWKCEVKEISR